MHFAGYAALMRLYDLPDTPHHVVSHIVKAARRTVGNQEYYPAIYAPENSLAGHLEFALKYEGVNLAILSAAIPANSPTSNTRHGGLISAQQ